MNLDPCPAIFDMRHCDLLQSIQLHSAEVNCILVNDVDGYLVTGSGNGDIKVCSHMTSTYTSLTFRQSSWDWELVNPLPTNDIYAS